MQQKNEKGRKNRQQAAVGRKNLTASEGSVSVCGKKKRVNSQQYAANRKEKETKDKQGTKNLNRANLAKRSHERSE